MSVFQPASLPDDAVEVGRVLDAWGIKGWVKVLAHSNEPQALLAADRWFVQPPEARLRPGFSAFKGTVGLTVEQCKVHSDALVAKVIRLHDPEAPPKYRKYVPWWA